MPNLTPYTLAPNKIVNPRRDGFTFPDVPAGQIVFYLYDGVTEAMLNAFLALDVQSSNRDLNTSHAGYLSTSFEKDGWHLTPEPIAFSSDDDETMRMLNGRHRCEGLHLRMRCEKVDFLPVQLLVSYGWHPETYEWIDDGRVRTEYDRITQIRRTNKDLAKTYADADISSIMALGHALRGGVPRRMSPVRFNWADVLRNTACRETIFFSDRTFGSRNNKPRRDILSVFLLAYLTYGEMPFLWTAVRWMKRIYAAVREKKPFNARTAPPCCHVIYRILAPSFAAGTTVSRTLFQNTEELIRTYVPKNLPTSWTLPRSVRRILR